MSIWIPPLIYLSENVKKLSSLYSKCLEYRDESSSWSTLVRTTLADCALWSTQNQPYFCTVSGTNRNDTNASSCSETHFRFPDHASSHRLRLSLMTVKGTSSLQRTTYSHLCFHDSMLIFRKQLISLGSGIIEFARVRGAEKMNNSAESMFMPPNPDGKTDNHQESIFQETIENKK